MKVIIIFTIFTLNYINLAQSSECIVGVNTSKIVNVVEKYYLSYCIDSGILASDVHWGKFNFSSPKLHTLLKEMSPSILRFGGSPADYLFFDTPYPPLNATQLQPPPVVLQKQDLLNLLKLTKDTNNMLLFDLNVQVRYGYQWDPSNAIQLMQFCRAHALTSHVAFELGNEPDWLIPDLITPERLAHDFLTLKQLLDLYKEFQFMVGPDVVSTDGVGGAFLHSVVEQAGQYLKAATFHHYYFRGDTAHYEDYLNPNVFSNLASVISNVQAVVKNTTNPLTPIWLGETSDAWHEGTPNVSDRFVSSFLWLDKLGLSALLGVDVVMRQTLYRLNYALLDVDMNPNPDYWLSWLFKKFVGDRVMKVDSACVDSYARSGKTSNAEGVSTFRMYAHCTRPSAEYEEGSLTMFGLNMAPEGVKVHFREAFRNTLVHVYLVQPDDGADDSSGDYVNIQAFVKEISILSKRVRVNGKLMMMPSDTSMPSIQPLIFHTSQPLFIPNFSYAFFVFPDINLHLCLT